MENIVTGTGFKKIDECAMTKFGIPSLVLMERAALSVADFVMDTAESDTVLVAAGCGNNGADGLAIARMLHLNGFNVKVCALAQSSKGTEEYKTQLKMLEKMGVPFINQPSKGLTNRVVLADALTDVDIVIDAIFGVGLSKNVEGKFAEIIGLINASEVTTYSVDIASGIDADTGKVMGKAVRADYTVTFGAHKIGTALYPGADYCGDVVVGDIGYPEKVFESAGDLLHAVDFEELDLIPSRPNYSNKGTFGKVLVIAGARDMAGAATMCAKAAYRTGAGLVRVFTAKENREIIQKTVPEAVLNTFDINKFDEKSLEASINWADVICVGPGLGVGDVQKAMVEAVLESKKPCVIDADGLNSIAEHTAVKRKLHKKAIVTPHLGEMGRLLAKKVDEIQDDLIKVARDYNYKTRANVVLKDARTIIATEDDTFVNMTGNSGMATAGSGDVLSGILTGLLAIGVDVKKASVLGPYVHGLAGDICAERYSETSMMATDMIEELADIF